MTDQFKTFAEFYPFYLSEHADKSCRRLHFPGSSLATILASFVVFSSSWVFLSRLVVVGYGFAWVGHFFFAKNTPFVFKQRLYSLLGDWVMLKDILTGKVKIQFGRCLLNTIGFRIKPAF